jgi:hypothetical protein
MSISMQPLEADGGGAPSLPRMRPSAVQGGFERCNRLQCAAAARFLAGEEIFPGGAL